MRDKKPHKARRKTLNVESLEHRQLLSALPLASVPAAPVAGRGIEEAIRRTAAAQAAPAASDAALQVDYLDRLASPAASATSRRLSTPPSVAQTAMTTDTASPLATPTIAAAATSVQTITPTEQTGMISNPNIGYQTFYRSAVSDPNVVNGSVKSKVYYTRVEWSDIEKTLGVYDWTPIDRELAAAKQAGQKFAFRVMPFEEGDSGPLAYKQAGLPGFTFSAAATTTWVPNYNNATVQQHMTRFIQAMGQRYGRDPAVDSVDIGMVGRWGEMHYYQCTPAPPLPTTETWKWLIDTFKASFRKPLLMNTDPVENNLLAFQYAMSKGIGWRDDGWSENWEMNTHLPRVLAAAPDAWKKAPIITEPSGTMRDTTAWRDALAWAIKNHVSEFSNKSVAIPSTLLPAVQDMIAKLGYRFVLTSASHATSVAAGSPLALTLNWTNKGNAPIYIDRNILVKIGDKVLDMGHNLKGFLPGSRTDVLNVSTTGLAPGTHNIQIGVAAPGHTNPDINLAIKGSTNRWYSVGSVTVT